MGFERQIVVQTSPSPVQIDSYETWSLEERLRPRDQARKIYVQHKIVEALSNCRRIRPVEWFVTGSNESIEFTGHSFLGHGPYHGPSTAQVLDESAIGSSPICVQPPLKLVSEKKMQQQSLFLMGTTYGTWFFCRFSLKNPLSQLHHLSHLTLPGGSGRPRVHAEAGGPLLRLWLCATSAWGHLHGHEGGQILVEHRIRIFFRSGKIC